MFQEIGGHTVYVVDLTEMPDLPIRSRTNAEIQYDAILKLFGGGNTTGLLADLKSSDPLKLYADGLNRAIETGVITTPGKYGIEVVPVLEPPYGFNWNVFRIIEPEVRDEDPLVFDPRDYSSPGSEGANGS